MWPIAAAISSATASTFSAPSSIEAAENLSAEADDKALGFCIAGSARFMTVKRQSGISAIHWVQSNAEMMKGATEFAQ